MDVMMRGPRVDAVSAPGPIDERQVKSPVGPIDVATLHLLFAQTLPAAAVGSCPFGMVRTWVTHTSIVPTSAAASS